MPPTEGSVAREGVILCVSFMLALLLSGCLSL